MAAKRSIKEFLRAVIEIEKTFGMSISHEDNHGAFIVEDLNLGDVQWLRHARNETGKPTGFPSARPNDDRPKTDWKALS